MAKQLLDRNSGALIMIGLGFSGAVFGYGQRFDREDIGGSHQLLGDFGATMLMGVSVALLVAGAAWAWALRRPSRPRPVDPSPWTGWIPESYVEAGDAFHALVPATITDRDGRMHRIVGTADGEHVRIEIPMDEDRGASFKHDVSTEDGPSLALRFNVFPSEIGAIAPPRESEHDPVEEAMARYLSTPEIAAALASFDLLEYRAACDRLSTGNAYEESAVARLRRTRRFFTWNQGPAPVLPTLESNVFGFRMIGRGDRHDETYVATNWVTVSFLPVWPTRSVVLASEDDAPLAEVPTDPRHRWATLAIAGVVAAIATTMAITY